MSLKRAAAKKQQQQHTITNITRTFGALRCAISTCLFMSSSIGLANEEFRFDSYNFAHED